MLQVYAAPAVNSQARVLFSMHGGTAAHNAQLVSTASASLPVLQILEQARQIEEKRKADAQATAAAAQHAAAQARKATTPGSARQSVASIPDLPFDPADLRYPQDFSNTPEKGVASLFNINLEPFRPPTGVYARGVHTRDTAVTQASSLLGTSS